MVSKVWQIMTDTDPAHDDAWKANELYKLIVGLHTGAAASQKDGIMDYLILMRKRLMDANDKYNQIMDANGNNPNEHYAKTMMLYGRKFCGSDIVNGIKASAVPVSPTTAGADSRYYFDDYNDLDSDGKPKRKPYIGSFTGLDDFFPLFGGGDVEIEWNCWDKDMTADGWKPYYRPDIGGGVSGVPEVESRIENHALGTMVQMPNVADFLDATHTSAGSNKYYLKGGYVINGWKIANNGTGDYKRVYRLDDGLNTYYNDPSTKTVQQDNRIFGYPLTSGTAVDSSFWLPYNMINWNSATSPGTLPYPRKIKFVLDIVTPWFTIVFKVIQPNGVEKTIPETAPAAQTIRTIMGENIRLPLATLIELDPGYEIDLTDNPNGTWSTINPYTKTTGMDTYGLAIQAQNFTPGAPYEVGFTAGDDKIDPTTDAEKKGTVWQETHNKYLYLKIKAS